VSKHDTTSEFGVRNQVAKSLAKKNELSKLLERLKSAGMSSQDSLVCIAALILARSIEGNRKASGSPQKTHGAEETPRQAVVIWQSLKTDAPDAFPRFLAAIQALLETQSSVNGPSLIALQSQIGISLQALAHIPHFLLNSLVEWVGRQNCDSSKERLALRSELDSLLMEKADKELAQHVTPPRIARLMIELANLQSGESICDPCFGSAGLLTAAADLLHGSQMVLAGNEIHAGIALVGLTRLFLSGVANPQLEVNDGLLPLPTSSPWRSGFDVVIANPPWGIEVAADFAATFPIPIRHSLSLFIQRSLSLANANGRIIMAVPVSFLSRQGKEGELRQWLVDNHTIDAIVALPAGAFKPNSTLETAILVIRKGGRTTSIRMVDAATDFKKAERLRVASSVMAAQIAHHVRSKEASPEAWNIDASAIAEENTGYDLSVRQQFQSELERQQKLGGDNVVRLGELCDIIEGIAVADDRLLDISIKSRSGYLSLPEAAALLGVSTDALKRFREQGEIRGFADRGTWKFRSQDLDEFIKTRPKSLEQSSDGKPIASGLPYIRIVDLRGDIASGSSARIIDADAETFPPTSLLRQGDILFSRSGTVDRVALVGDGAVGGIAAGGFYVIRIRDARVHSKHLLAYLQSDEVRAWINAKSRRTAARHLSLSALCELPVLLLAVIQQNATLVDETVDDEDSLEWSEADDGSVRLFFDERMFEDKVYTDETVERWLHTFSDKIRMIDPQRRSTLEGAVLAMEEISGSTISVLSKTEHRQQTGRPSYLLWPWASVVQNGLSIIKGISSIPDAIGAQNVLQTARGRLSDSLALIPSGHSQHSAASNLTGEIVRFIDSTVERLFADVQLLFEVVHAVRLPDNRIELELSVENRGSLPLRDLGLQFTPELPPTAASIITYLSPREPFEMRFRGTDKRDDFASSFLINWEGQLLDGKKISGIRELAVNFSYEAQVDATARDRSEDLGGSPYICGDPVKPDRQEVFFGREDLLSQIRRQICERGNVVLLEGNRRAGKSSILSHLEGRDAVPGWLGVYFSLQEAEGDLNGCVSTANVFRGMAYAIVQAMRQLNGRATMPDGTILDANRKFGINRAVHESISDETPFGDFREYVQYVLEELAGQDLGLLLMIDEFDKLQEGIDNNVTSPQVPENIRFLIQSYPRFSAILTGSRRLKRMREEYFSALFGLGTRIGVTSLPQDAAKRLVTDPVKGRLAFASDAVQLACDLTACQPYLLQCLCNRIFDLAAQRDVRSITKDHVRDAAKALVQDNEHFSSLWDYTGSDRRRFLLALLHREASSTDVMRLRVIEEKLQQHGVEVSEETLISDLESLYELELVAFPADQNGTQYSLAVPMMGDWIESQPQADFEALRIRAQIESEDSIG